MATEAQKAASRKHHKIHSEDLKVYRQDQKELWMKWLPDEYKRCWKCGYSKNFAAIDFHRVNPGLKKVLMGSLFGGVYSPKKIKLAEEELGKCIPLCSNCHRELHAELRCTP